MRQDARPYQCSKLPLLLLRISNNADNLPLWAAMCMSINSYSLFPLDGSRCETPMVEQCSSIVQMVKPHGKGQSRGYYRLVGSSQRHQKAELYSFTLQPVLSQTIGHPLNLQPFLLE
jgi:hypothetical protein